MRFLMLGLALLSGSAFAQYRCVEDGRTTFTDRPCADMAARHGAIPRGNAPKVIGDAGKSAYATPMGTWRGDIQYQATGRAGINPDAMAVVPLVIDIDPQGKITGASPENGCHFKGIATRSGFPTSIALDVTLSGCRFAAYNRRLLGVLSVNQAQQFASFTLHGHAISPLMVMTFFDLKGTLRR